MTDTDEIQEQLQRQFMADLHPVEEELKSIGLPSVADLHSRHVSRIKYKAAIPILVRWLFDVKLDRTRSMLLRVLQDPWAGPEAARPMIQAFHMSEVGQPFYLRKWEIGAILDYVANDSIADDLIAIAEDKTHGRDRIMAVSGVGRLKDPRAAGALIELLNDPDVLLGAISGLHKLAPAEARPHLALLMNHKEPWVRRQAQKAINKIDKKHPGVYPPLVQRQHQINAVGLKQPLPSGHKETSTGCDFEDLEPLLTDLAALVSLGFGKSEIEQVLAGVQELDDTRGRIAYDFPINYDGQQTTVRLVIRMKNGDPELAVYALPRLIDAFEPMIRERD